jgi:hypothetical protein|tara:strand:+ start:114 stop:362 length:249 start_codon:yes stop_codon:yes gene_type:complete
MFASVEKSIIKKKYKENLNANYLWAYYNLNQQKHIDLRYDFDNSEYVFSFPLNNSKMNYVAHFKDFEDVKRYVKYIVSSYII